MAGIRKPDRPSFALTVTYAASPRAVWRAWTDPAALRSWFRPSEAWTILAVEADARPGGRIRLVMQEAGGPVLEANGVYQEVVPEETLSFTWSWKGSPPEHESLVTVRLRARDDGTELELRHERFIDTHERDEHAAGWRGSLGLLARLVEPTEEKR